MNFKFLSFLYKLRKDYYRLKLNIKSRLGLIKPLKVIPYIGYGNHKDFYIKGRLIEDNGLAVAMINNSGWQNFTDTLKRFTSSEIPDQLVRANFFGEIIEDFTDDEGYFDFHFQKEVKDLKMWNILNFTVDSNNYTKEKNLTASGLVLVPDERASYGIVSDMDDTVIQTEVLSWWKMVKLTFLSNQHTRLPFDGVSKFYKLLQKGKNEEGVQNPIFYVSSSPWNLFDLLYEFLKLKDIPLGPLMLRDIGLSKTDFLHTDHSVHKFFETERILSTFPHLKFILIGDSGQDDIRIYRKVAADFPGRVMAIYIRDVAHLRDDPWVMKMKNELEKEKVPLLLMDHSDKAITHAISMGFIDADEV